MAQCSRSKSGIFGCHLIFFTGEWCMITATAADVLIDHNQTVEGIESLLVASRSPSLLNSIADTPVLEISAMESEARVGGHAGCGAMT